MSTVPVAAYLHRKKNKYPERKRLNRVGILTSTIISLFIVVVIFITAWFYASLTRDLPSLAYLPVLLDPPNGILLQPTQIYDRSGEYILRTLKNPASGERQYLALPLELREDQAWQVSSPKSPESQAQLPAELVDATLAILEPNFWSSPGFSFYGLLSGTSPTLAQRLVSNLLLQEEPQGLRRNIRERLLAAQVTKEFGRAKILEWYLNSAQYGPLVYGAHSAAQVYFDKPADELTLAEAALIAAAEGAPALTPLDAPTMAADRQRQALIAMHERGFISQNELHHAVEEQLTYREKVSQPADPFYAFTELVLEELYNQLGPERIERGGLKIRTTLDHDLQVQVSCAATLQISRLEAPPSGGMLLDLPDCPAARLLPTLALDNQSEPGSLTAEAVVIAVRTGEILALAGDQTSTRYRIGQSLRSPGTLMTPFIYLTAFTHSMGPASLVWDIPLDGDDASQNVSNQIYHGPVSLRTAFANDYWVPAIQITKQVGSENVLRFSRQFGLSSLDISDLDSLLSADQNFSVGGASVLEMGHAYSVFANQGVLAGRAAEDGNGTNGLPPIKPLIVLSVEDIVGHPWMDCEVQSLNCSPQSRPLVSPQLAYLITDILSDEPARWPSMGHPNPLEIGRPTGAKLGRVGTSGQAWTAGFTPQIAAVVWMGELSPTPQEQPSDIATRGAAALWHAVIQYAHRDLKPESWSIPPGISRVETCYPSGLLPSNNCPTIARELFLDSNVPHEPDNLYRVFQINRETGQLATIFTPSELVENRVYLVVPPPAVEWAQAAGLPVPPDTYDAIPAASLPQEYIHIASPGIFSHVSGNVSIQGTAGGPDFAYFRVQVGKGLNPREWIQIGESDQTPVRNGVLAEWDVTGLSGLYAIQLQVVSTQLEMETYITQVTIDNQAPELSIQRPVDKQRFNDDQEQFIILQVNAEDDIGLQKVEFYIDDRLISTLREPPFTVSWLAIAGVHTLRVKAYDQAENASEASLVFTVDR
jgi:membrane peptidoglycan carboxypeptidase